MRFQMRLVAATLAVALLGCLRAAAQEGAKEDLVTIQARKDQPVAEFLDAAAALTGRPILYDPASQRIRGATMAAEFQQAVPRSRVLDFVRSILAFYEITLVPVGPQGYDVLLALDSRSTNNLVKSKAEFVPYERLDLYADRDGLYIACAIPVRHVENLTMLRTALSTMVTPAGIGRVHEVPGSRSILVMDLAPSVVAIARVVREADREPEPTVARTIPLSHAQAAPLAATLRELFAPEGEPKAPPQMQPSLAPTVAPRIAAYEPGNTIVIVATERDLARIEEVIRQLDSIRSQAPSGKE